METYRLPNFLREEFGRPLGVVVPGVDQDRYVAQLPLRDEMLVTVGDRTTEFFVSRGHRPHLQLVDAKEKRANRPAPVGGFDHLSRVKNPPGQMTGEAIALIKAKLQEPEACRVMVDGEEDLLVLPAILFSPDGADVFYGQPGLGMVHVKVGPDARRRAAELLGKMGYQATE